MSKRLHPIRRMANDLSRYWLKVTSSGKGTNRAVEVAGENAILVRSVKPLLDALERDGHGVMFSERKDVVRCKHIGGCADCRLLAAWKEPIK